MDASKGNSRNVGSALQNAPLFQLVSFLDGPSMLLTAFSFPVGLAGRFLPFAFPPEMLLPSTGWWGT